jgi:hypothetical protein
VRSTTIASSASRCERALRGKLDYAPVGFELTSEQFTLLQLQRVHRPSATNR